jgi:hypothetical protein
MASNPQFVRKVGGRLSADGQVGELDFIRENGEKVLISFPMRKAGTLVMSIEQAIGELFAAQAALLKGGDPRMFFGVGSHGVKKLLGGTAQGKPILSLEMDTGLRLDFHLGKIQIRDLISWLEELAALDPEYRKTQH